MSRWNGEIPHSEGSEGHIEGCFNANWDVKDLSEQQATNCLWKSTE